jgi:hypothetical protein
VSTALKTRVTIWVFAVLFSLSQAAEAVDNGDHHSVKLWGIGIVVLLAVAFR